MSKASYDYVILPSNEILLFECASQKHPFRLTLLLEVYRSTFTEKCCLFFHHFINNVATKTTHTELLNTPLLVSKIICFNFLQQKNCSKLICDSSDIEGTRIYLHCLRFSFSRNKLLLFFYLCGLASWLKIVFGSLALANMGC